jgi:hypothetical protein
MQIQDAAQGFTPNSAERDPDLELFPISIPSFFYIPDNDTARHAKSHSFKALTRKHVKIATLSSALARKQTGFIVFRTLSNKHL